ncbi:7-carboxy-7-deazaguanine synthase QueE [Bacteroidota bacterium]
MKKIELSTGKLPIIEAFYTIQGEGHHAGKPAYFIRLGGCDVGCHWCDVKESWDASLHPLVDVVKIADKATDTNCKLAVITGGEPLLYNLDLLTSELKKRGIKTHIETSGVHPLSGNWDWICFSPKKFKKPLDEFFVNSDELKVVIYNKSDFKWAEELVTRVEGQTIMSLQPEWDRSHIVLPLIIDYVKENPHWEISLQIHKFMNIP